jgi:hypothetical protein
VAPLAAEVGAVIRLGQALIVLLVIAIWTVIGVGCQSCQDRGGQYVRTVGWFTCIEEDS